MHLCCTIHAAMTAGQCLSGHVGLFMDNSHTLCSITYDCPQQSLHAKSNVKTVYIMWRYLLMPTAFLRTPCHWSCCLLSNRTTCIMVGSPETLDGNCGDCRWLKQDFLQATCHSWCITNCVRALKIDCWTTIVKPSLHVKYFEMISVFYFAC